MNQILCNLIEQSKREIAIITKRNLSSFNVFMALIDYISYSYFKYCEYFLPDLKLKYQESYNEKYLPYKNEIVLLLIKTIKKCQSRKLFMKFSPELFAKSYLSLLQRFVNKENEDTIMENLDTLNIFSFIYISALLNNNCKSKYCKIIKNRILLVKLI